MCKTIFAAIILIVHAPFATCETAADVKALRTKLFVTDGYDYRVRPTDDQSSPIEITVDLYLLSINELSEARETMKATAFLALRWEDTFLRWNPANYNNTQHAFWPQNEVWKPDIALKNSNQDYKELGVPSLNVFNLHDGSVIWYPFQVFEATCSIDIRHLPFDDQTCYLKFQAWSYTIDEVVMQGGSTGIETTNYEANSNWDLVDSSWNVESDTDDSTITFSLRLKRKPLFFMLSVIFPIITLAILNLCVFLLPCECQERASYAITVFLAFAVFLTIISSSLPKNSESVAAISVFLVIQTICGTLITGIALALLRLCSFDERDKKVAIPRILIFLMQSLKCKSCSNSSKVVPKNDTKMPATEIELDATESAMGASDFKLSDIQMPPQKRATERRMSDESSIGDVEYSWKEVVNFLDVLLFVIFAVILVASLLGCFVGAQNS